MLTRLRTACAIAALGVVFGVQLFAAPAALPHLRGVGEIRDWFNAGRGHVRLILLLSPT